MSKQRWQNATQESRGYVLRQSDPGVLPPLGDGRWRNRRVQVFGRLWLQYRLLRIPLTFLSCGLLLFATVSVAAWLQPIPRPLLITLSSASRRMMLQTNTFATRDARALKELTRVFDASRADPDSLNRDEMLALIKRIGETGVKRSHFAWQKSTEFVYVNAPGVAIFDGGVDQLVPYLLPDDFVVHWNGESALREHAVPLTMLLDQLALSKSDNKVLVLDCQQIDHLWAEGILTNQFVEAVTALLQRSSQRYRGLFVICSCSAGEVAWGDPGAGHSIFAQSLLNGLNGEADSRGGDQDGRITLDELLAYLSREVAQWTLHCRNDRQSPFLVASLGSPEEVVLASAESKSRPVARRAESATPSADNSQKAQLLGELKAAWEGYYTLAASRPIPFHYAPHRWRHLEEALLRAESCFQDSDFDAMTEELRSIPLRVAAIEEARHLPLVCHGLFSLPMMECLVSIGHARTAEEIPRPIPSNAPQARTDAESTPKTESASSVAESVSPVVKLDCSKLLNRLLDDNEPADVLGRELLARRATDAPLPVEAELLRMIADQWSQLSQNADRLELQARARELIRIRVLAEQAALPAGFYAPATFRWVKPWVDLADKFRRIREDDFFTQGGRPIVIEPVSRAYANEDEELYQRTRSEAAKIARALAVHERVLCEVSYCVRLAALRRSEGEASPFQETFETLTRSLLGDATLLSRDLQSESPDWTVEERSLKIAEIEGLAIRLETTRSAVLQQVEEEVRQLAQIGAAGNAGSEEVWRRIDAILRLPFAYSHEPPSALAQRRAMLLKHLECCTNHKSRTLDDDFLGFDQPPSPDLRELTRRRAMRAESGKTLALAFFGLPSHASLPDDDRDLESLGYSSRVARACAQTYLTAVTAVADPMDFNRLIRADEACRIFEAGLLDRGFSCDEQIPSRLLWRSQIAGICAWHGQRFAEDFLAGSAVAAEPYFLKSVRTYLELAHGLVPQSNSNFIELENRLADLKTLAEQLRNPSGTGILFAQPTNPKFRGTTEQTVRFAFEAPVACPNGTARLRCLSSGEQLSVRSLPAETGAFPFPYELSRTESPGFSSALHAELFFRGHVCHRQLTVEGIDDENGPCVIYRDDRSNRAELSVRLAEADRRPANVLFVLDCSRSMADGDRMKILISSLRKFAAKAAGGEWNLGIRVFGDRVVWQKGDRAAEAAARMDTRLLLPVQPFSAESFQDRLADIRPTGESPLFQALLQARQDFPSSARGEKVIIVVSDGEDNWASIGGKPGPDELEQAYRGSRIQIHTIGFQTDAPGYSQLQKIAATSGGACVQADAAEDLLSSLLEMMRIVNFSVSVQQELGPDREVHQGTVGFAGELISLEPGRYSVRVTEQRGAVIAERSDLQLAPGQRHELTLQGGSLIYPRLDLSTDLAVARDADEQMLLRILRGNIRANGLEMDLALVNEGQPEWAPRRIEIRVRPRNNEQWYVFRNLPANVAGYHFPVWRLRLEKWPRAAANAEVEVAWSDTEDPTPPRILRWESPGLDPDLPAGLNVTRREFKAVPVDGKLQDAAELTVVFSEDDSSLPQWSFGFPGPVAYSRQIYNAISGVYSGRFVFRDGNAPSTLEIRVPQKDDNRSRLKTSFNLRLREISRDTAR